MQSGSHQPPPKNISSADTFSEQFQEEVHDLHMKILYMKGMKVLKVKAEKP
jgi:hypothetical protein